MMTLARSVWITVVTLFFALCDIATAVTSEKPLMPVRKAIYKAGQTIPVSCLNRTIDTGEHISDEKGQLQYIPFPTCNETGRPLELYFGVEKDTNCTIPFITDELFHLLEFYIHNDAPLSCRIPARPLGDGEREITPSSTASASDEYIPIIFALLGTLQLSHLHISTSLNILLHSSSQDPFTVDSATAYSTSPLTSSTRIVIGDPLPLKLSVRWYPTTNLPSGWTGLGGHLYISTVVYCVLGAIVGVFASMAWFRGVELPRRLKSGQSVMNLGGAHWAGRGGGYGLPAGTGWGKRD